MKIVKIKTGRYGERVKSKVRMFIHPIRETVVDSLYLRQIGPQKFYRSLILPDALRKLNLPVETKASWKRNGGCHCGCSPCYILDISPDVTGYEAIWVDIG